MTKNKYKLEYEDGNINRGGCKTTFDIDLQSLTIICNYNTSIFNYSTTLKFKDEIELKENLNNLMEYKYHIFDFPVNNEIVFNLNNKINDFKLDNILKLSEDEKIDYIKQGLTYLQINDIATDLDYKIFNLEYLDKDKTYVINNGVEELVVCEDYVISDYHFNFNYKTTTIDNIRILVDENIDDINKIITTIPLKYIHGIRFLVTTLTPLLFNVRVVITGN